MANNEEEISNLLASLNKERKKSLFFFVLVIIIAVFVGAGGFAFIVVGGISGGNDQGLFLGLGFPMFFIGSSLSIVCIKISSSYKKRYYESIINRFSSDFYKSIKFSFKKDASDVKSLSLFPKETPKFDDDETFFYEGAFEDGTKFFSYFVTRTVVGPAHPFNVYGRYIEFVLPNNKNRLFLLKPNASKTMFDSPKLSEKISTESIAFSKEYEAFASSQIEGKMFLRPTLVDFFASSTPSFSLSSNEGDVRVYIDGITPNEEVGLNVKPSREGINKVKKEVMSFALLYKEIKESL